MRADKAKAAPLSLVISLIAIVALCTMASMGYTFLESANIRSEMNDRLGKPLAVIQSELVNVKSTQAEIKAMIQKHMFGPKYQGDKDN